MLQPPHRPILALATLLTALAVAPSAANAAGATVVKVVDGDTVRIKENGRTRTVDLRGVDAPEKADCHGAEATKALKRLLPRGARVQVRSGSVKRAGKLVNEALVRSGDARATGGQLTAAQDAARKAGRGLWAACPADRSRGTPPPTGGTPPPPSDVLTGDAAIQRARTDLQGRKFTRIRTHDVQLHREPPAPVLGRLVRRAGLDLQRLRRHHVRRVPRPLGGDRRRVPHRLRRRARPAAQRRRHRGLPRRRRPGRAHHDQRRGRLRRRPATPARKSR